MKLEEESPSHPQLGVREILEMNLDLLPKLKFLCWYVRMRVNSVFPKQERLPEPKRRRTSEVRGSRGTRVIVEREDDY